MQRPSIRLQQPLQPPFPFRSPQFAVRSTGITSIASIAIGGSLVGGNDSDSIDGLVDAASSGVIATDSLGPVKIGVFKSNGITVALTPGASTDTFALGKAQAVGASLSTTNADGFEV
jgi:hypothetical protein